MNYEIDNLLYDSKMKIYKKIQDIGRRLYSTGLMDVIEVDENDKPLLWEYKCCCGDFEVSIIRDREANYEIAFRRRRNFFFLDWTEVNKERITNGEVSLDDLINIIFVLEEDMSKFLKFVNEEYEEYKEVESIKKVLNEVRKAKKLIARELAKIARFIRNS